jgi:hypothetical protein
VVRFASCESNFPALLGAAGLLRQYVRVLLRNRGDPSPRPCGHFPAAPAMLGTANGAVDPRIRASLHYLEVVHQRDLALAAASAAGCRPSGAPCGAARVRRIRPKEAAHDARPFAECTRMYIQRTPERPREVGRQDAWRPRHRGVFLWLPFFAQALRRRSGANSIAGRVAAEGRMPGVKKVTGSPQARRSSALDKKEAWT